MSAKPDGGPAFPRRLPDGEWPPDEAVRLVKAYAGMSLRDYFAAAALTGILASDNEIGPATATQTAYIMADRMIAERAEEAEK
jgi:hypothetical protein